MVMNMRKMFLRVRCQEKGNCEVCGKKGRRCQGCFRIHYCGPLCQKKNWKEHSTVENDKRISRILGGTERGEGTEEEDEH